MTGSVGSSSTGWGGHFLRMLTSKVPSQEQKVQEEKLKGLAKFNQEEKDGRGR